MDEPTSAFATDRRPTRRTVLGAVGGGALGSIAGCLGGDETADVPAPISIADDRGCDNCTMIVGNHPGPAGQAHYEDPTAVLEEDRPAQFCSSLCTYAFTFKQDVDPTVSYLTDYSTLEYDIEEGDDGPVISRHLDADGFGDRSGLTLIAGSDVGGAMGDSLVPFSDGDDAAAFQEEHGGDSYDHDEITQELVMSMM
ncbi:nitrous oxide reductase accessory protein NosL [Natrinema ejinorense]|uniref:Nitrous oxide reductase accessory protein NosL n=1 Tax=Natrinema ejinorense TaxID=373386 RepID=A0A2A5QQD4_9EURY|nr:nitrous oxide reductase accessory protein NosL [Natrinema ejinorense]PCR89071.1 nitrous oxide reductase accessory protein NosL [Natrinema ejinorense]